MILQPYDFLVIISKYIPARVWSLINLLKMNMCGKNLTTELFRVLNESESVNVEMIEIIWLRFAFKIIKQFLWIKRHCSIENNESDIFALKLPFFKQSLMTGREDSGNVAWNQQLFHRVIRIWFDEGIMSYLISEWVSSVEKNKYQLLILSQKSFEIWYSAQYQTLGNWRYVRQWQFTRANAICVLIKAIDHEKHSFSIKYKYLFKITFYFQLI